MEIFDLLDKPHLARDIVGLILTEWPKPERDAATVEMRLWGKREPERIPFTLVALAGADLVGFVNVTLWQQGIAEGRPHWIDSLYVSPSWRGTGISTQLIEAAEQKAETLGVSRLLALTELPGVYLRAGWHVLDSPKPENPLDFVMAKSL